MIVQETDHLHAHTLTHSHNRYINLWNNMFSELVFEWMRTEFKNGGSTPLDGDKEERKCSDDLYTSVYRLGHVIDIIVYACILGAALSRMFEMPESIKWNEWKAWLLNVQTWLNILCVIITHRLFHRIIYLSHWKPVYPYKFNWKTTIIMADPVFFSTAQ